MDFARISKTIDFDCHKSGFLGCEYDSLRLLVQAGFTPKNEAERFYPSSEFGTPEKALIESGGLFALRLTKAGRD